METKIVKVELTWKFIIYFVVLAVVGFLFWETRETVISILLMGFIAFIINAGLRPAVAFLQRQKIKDLFLWPMRFGRDLTIGLALLFGEHQEARESTASIADGARDLWRNQLQKQRLLRPINRFLEIKFGRGLSIATVYLGMFAFIGFVLFSFTSEFARQLVNLYEELPTVVNSIINFIQFNFPAIDEALQLDSIQEQISLSVNQLSSDELLNRLLNGDFSFLSNFVSDLVPTAFDLFSSVAGAFLLIFTIIIVSIYMLLSEEPFYEPMVRALPTSTADHLHRLLKEIEQKLGAWLGGQLTLMLAVGILTYFILIIPGFFYADYRLDEFALPLAFLAALLEALPNLGPTLTTIVTGLLAVGTSGIGSVVYVILMFAGLQQIEAVFIVPQVMKRAVGVDPIVSILGVIAGFQIGGVLGAILAIPVIGIAQIFVVEIVRGYKKSHDVKAISESE